MLGANIGAQLTRHVLRRNMKLEKQHRRLSEKTFEYMLLSLMLPPDIPKRPLYGRAQLIQQQHVGSLCCADITSSSVTNQFPSWNWSLALYFSYFVGLLCIRCFFFQITEKNLDLALKTEVTKISGSNQLLVFESCRHSERLQLFGSNCSIVYLSMCFL